MLPINIVSFLDFYKYIRYAEWLPKDISYFAISGEDINLLQTKVIFTISLQTRITYAEDLWLKSTYKAILYSKKENLVVISSIGGINWEYPLWLTTQHKVNTIIILPYTFISQMFHLINETTLQLNLDLKNITFILPVYSKRLSKEEQLHNRDKLALSLADRVFPISIRNGGFWMKNLKGVTHTDNRFKCEYIMNKALKFNLEKSIGEFPETQDYLFHWTRGSYKPWFGERKADFFNDLTNAKFGNPRDGLATLSHILEVGILRGNYKMYRGKISGISFTSLPPNEMIKKQGFRNTLGRYNFEPYGIALPKERLKELGAKPVIYGDDELYQKLNENDKPYFQYKGLNSKTDWTSEQEWRLIGDLDLTTFRDEMRVIIPYKTDQLKLPKQFQDKTIPLFS